MVDLESPKKVHMTNGNNHTSVVHIVTENGHHDNRKTHEKIEGPKTKLEKIQQNIDDFCKTYHGLLSMSTYTILSSLYVVYLGFALAHDQEKAAPVVVVSIIFGLGVFYFKVLKVHYGKAFMINIWNPSSECMSTVWNMKFIRWITYGCFVAAFILYLIIDTADNRNRLIPLGGMIFYLTACFVFSTNPARVRWRPVIAGIVMQFVVGLLVLRWPLGLKILTYIAQKTTQFLDYAQHGTKFVYGFLADPPNICNMNAVFAFTVLQTLLYFGSVIALLYYFGIMQFILHQMAWVMQLTLGTTAAESLNAAGCIFLGMTEGPLMIRPYFAKMTRSELHTVFASGFACVTGSLLAAYINFGACPLYLICACVMSAPASISISKLLMPEVEESQLKSSSDLILPPSSERNALEAISQGASTVINIVAEILANLVVFVAILAFVDSAIWSFFDLVGWNITFQQLLGYLFFPLAFIMGSSDAPEWDRRINETMIVAQLMGTKTVVNEFIAYKDMSAYVQQGLISGRAQMMATFTLCGFSNFGSIGMQLGLIGSLCPEKRPVVAEIILRSLVSGAVACFMTACVAGKPVMLLPILPSLIAHHAIRMKGHNLHMTLYVFALVACYILCILFFTLHINKIVRAAKNDSRAFPDALKSVR